MDDTDQRLKIIHADAALVVVEKPGGLLSVPGCGPDNQDCVVKRIKAMFPACIEQPAVHRLDMFTSGLMVLALTAKAQANLSRQFQDRAVEKRYIALLDGHVNRDSGTITLSFRLDPANRPFQIYDPVQGKTGTTLWKRIAIEGGNTRVEFIPLTGRTHQLRLHAAHELGLGCPVVGDKLYGSGQEGEKMMLHASFLSFLHPDTSRRFAFSSPPPF